MLHDYSVSASIKKKITIKMHIRQYDQRVTESNYKAMNVCSAIKEISKNGPLNSHRWKGSFFFIKNRWWHRFDRDVTCSRITPLLTKQGESRHWYQYYPMQDMPRISWVINRPWATCNWNVLFISSTQQFLEIKTATKSIKLAICKLFSCVFITWLW